MQLVEETVDGLNLILLNIDRLIFVVSAFIPARFDCKGLFRQSLRSECGYQTLCNRGSAVRDLVKLFLIVIFAQLRSTSTLQSR